MTLTEHQSTRRYGATTSSTSSSMVRSSDQSKRRQANNNNNNNNSLSINNNIAPPKVIHSVPIPQSSSSHQNALGQTTRLSQQQQQQHSGNAATTTTTSSSSFIDCLIRRFKDCFSQDFCSVPVFVVGNLSPGSDGHHLILPPCISLSGQCINRFASPKNLRLMNQIRESCRNVEELDLGTNRLNDLVEIYKILQVTPNLRILNLSENDLSRAMPMAMATNTNTTTTSNTTSSSGCVGTGISSASTNSASRSYLGPLNGNSLPRRYNSSLFHGSHPHSSSTTGQQVLRPTSNATGGSARPTHRTGGEATNSTAVNSASSMRPNARPSAGGPSTGIKERRAARASAAISRSVSALSAKDTRATVAAHRSKQQQQANSKQKLSGASQQVAGGTRGCDDVLMAPLAPTNVGSALQAIPPPGHYTPSGSIYFRRIFESIKVLAMNNTRCPWRVVCSILLRMPQLEELHLSLNNYEKIELEPVNFKHYQLRRLYLCNNPKLTNWTELDKILAAFPSLEALSIADCNISQIPDNLDRAREWRKLCGLNIAGWPIKEWPVIERLNQLPSLVDLKCQNLELLNEIEEPENRRHHLIARLPKLIRLNGSEIEEREHAEKAFVRFFITNQHLERPDRFYELFQVHGEVRPVADVDLSPPSKANVTIVYYLNKNQDDILISEDFLTKILDQTSMMNQQDSSTGNESAPDEDEDESDRQLCNPMDQWNKPQFISKTDHQEVVAMTVDLRKSVRNFKVELSQIFNTSDSSKLTLYYIDHEMVGLMGPELMRHNQKKLWNYNVQDGDQFILEEA